MRKSLLLMTVLSLALLVPLASAASWQNQDVWTGYVSNDVAGALTVTPGASGEWVTGGYDFHGTASATRTGFAPLHGVSRFSVAVWVTVTNSTSPGMVFSERVDASNKVNFYVYSDDVIFALASPPANFIVTVSNCVSNGNKSLIMMVWDKDLNSGRMTGYVYDENTGVTRSGTSGSGHTGTISANATMYLGAQDATTSLFSGIIWQFAIYPTLLNASERLALQTNSETVLESASYYWTLNEGDGVIMLPGNPAWFHEGAFSLSAVSSAPYVPAWLSQDEWIAYPDVAAPVVDISPFLPPWFSLLGLILVPASMSYPFVKKRMTGDIEFNDLGMAILMFFLGLAFLIGSVV